MTRGAATRARRTVNCPRVSDNGDSLPYCDADYVDDVEAAGDGGCIGSPSGGVRGCAEVLRHRRKNR